MFYDKNIAPSEEMSRYSKQVVNQTLLGELGKDELTVIERKNAVKNFGKALKDYEDWERKNSRLDYQIGEKLGFVKGIFAGGVLTIALKYAKEGLVYLLAAKKK